MNISKTRRFPDNEYEVYKWDKKERGRWINIWFRKPDFITKQKKIIPNNDYWTIKKVDKDTANHLYGKEWNSVSLNIFKSYRFIKKESLFEWNMKAMIHSIDDSSYGIWFQDKSLEELEEIRLKIMCQVDIETSLNGEEFLSYCESLGGIDKDYN